MLGERSFKIILDLSRKSKRVGDGKTINNGSSFCKPIYVDLVHLAGGCLDTPWRLTLSYVQTVGTNPFIIPRTDPSSPSAIYSIPTPLFIEAGIHSVL